MARDERRRDRKAAGYMKNLYVVDAPNMVYRAAFTGDLTEQLESMLQRFISAAEPEYVVSAWDDPEGSWRHKLYDGYKADRSRKIEIDWETARSIFGYFGIPIIRQPRAEADDLIASAAAQAPEDFRVVALSMDKDLFQILDYRTVLARRNKGENEIWRAEDVLNKYGVEPWQWPDVMALAGGKNGIPGLPKVGFKGACKLIAGYRSLSRLLDLCNTVLKPSHRKSLEEYKDEALLYLKLMTLRTDFNFDMEEWGLAR